MANFIVGILSLTIGVVVLSDVFITTVKAANQTGVVPCTGTNCTAGDWSAAEVSLWSLITLVAIAGIVYGVMNVFGLT